MRIKFIPFAKSLGSPGVRAANVWFVRELQGSVRNLTQKTNELKKTYEDRSNINIPFPRIFEPWFYVICKNESLNYFYVSLLYYSRPVSFYELLFLQ